MLQELGQQVAEAGWADWLALLTSVAYVVLAARGSNWCWGFAAISTAVWAYQSFVVYQLVSDGLLQVFYFVMAGVGLWRWQQGEAGEVLAVSSMSWREHGWVIGGSLLAGVLLGYLFSNTLVAAATYPDALTTAFSVSTTFLLIQRRLENWLYWVVIDLAYVGIYLSTEAILFAAMINVGVAIAGYWSWRKEWRRGPMI